MRWGDIMNLLKVYLMDCTDTIDEIDEQIKSDYQCLLLCSLSCKSSDKFTYTDISPTTAHYLAICEDYRLKCMLPNIKDVREELKVQVKGE